MTKAEYNRNYQRRRDARFKAAGLTVNGTPRIRTYADLSGFTPEQRHARKRAQMAARSRAFRDRLREPGLQHKGPEKSARMDIGLALLSARARWGVPIDRVEIAAWAGCTTETIRQIEERALRKLRLASISSLKSLAH